MARKNVKQHVTPTIRQKIKLYEKVKEIITSHHLGYRGICDCLKKAQRQLDYVRDVKNPPINWQTWDISACGVDDKGNSMQENFPELYMHKPVHKGLQEYWWETGYDGYDIRKGVLSKIIADLKAELSKEIREKHVANWKTKKEKKEYRKSHPDFDFDL